MLVPWAIIAAANGDISLAIGLFVIYLVVVLQRQLLEPKIVGSKIGIHPIFTLIAMYTGFRMIGVLRNVYRTNSADYFEKYIRDDDRWGDSEKYTG